MLLPSLASYPNLILEKKRVSGQDQFWFLCKIPFDDIEGLQISIANRELVSGGSGLFRHFFDANGKLVDPNGVRVLGDRVLTRSQDKRVLHWPYERHLQELGFQDERGYLRIPGILSSWRDLGQNPWHLFWEPAEDTHTWRLKGEFGSGAEYVEQVARSPRNLTALREDEIFGVTRGKNLKTGRVYSALTFSHSTGTPGIADLRVDEQGDIWDADLQQCLSEELQFAASGKALLMDGRFVAHERVEQYYDLAHVFPVSDRDPEFIEGVSDRPRKGELLERLYRGYPNGFGQRCQEALSQGLGTARYYFNIVGVGDDRTLCFLHVDSTLEGAAHEASRCGMRSAIIVDEGGSVSLFSTFRGPKGSYENISSYFRPTAIAVLGVRLKH